MNRKTKLKLVFCAVIVAQPLQYAFVSLAGEPYPALFMPGFGSPRRTESGAYATNSVDLVVEFSDGTMTEASTRELIEPIPPSHMNQIMNWVFRPQRDEAVEVESRLEQFLESYVLRAYATRDESKTTGFEDPETRAWLASNLGRLFPGEEPVAAEFRWMSDLYTVQDSELVRTRDLEEVRRVELD